MSMYENYNDVDPGPAGSPMAVVNEFGYVDFAQMNKGITPLFFMNYPQDEAESERCGTARFISQECVRLIIAGSTLEQPVLPVDAYIRQRFAEAYAHWKASAENKQINGTPLAAWPLMTPIQVKEFEALHIRSIEDLATVGDNNIERIPNGYQWKRRAAAHLSMAENSANAMRLAEENAALKERLDKLEAALSAKPKVKRVRRWAKKPATAIIRREGKEVILSGDYIEGETSA